MELNNIKQLKFGIGNKKLAKNIATFSLPVGFSCPMAKDCLTFVNRDNGKITDGKTQKFRCFAAHAEACYPAVRKSRWNNFEALQSCKTADNMALLIQSSLPEKQNTIRINTAGDFFNQAYFDAWLMVAKSNPNKLFYAYTKSIPFYLKRQNEIPENFKITCSFGGKKDDLIKKHNLVSAKVFKSESEASKANLKVDNDDSLARKADKCFALVLHGNGKAGSLQSKAHNLKIRKA